jgi:hypothetical protein
MKASSQTEGVGEHGVEADICDEEWGIIRKLEKTL